MSEQATTTEDTKTPPAPAGGVAITPPQATPKVEPPKEPKTEPKAKLDTEDSAEADDKENDNTPKADANGLVTMPLKKFMQRVSRMTRRELKKNFGTDDLEAIVKEREELKLLREEKAEAARKSMSERERLEADVKNERAKREAAEARASEMEEGRRVDRAERIVTGIASEVIAPKYVEQSLDAMAKYMRKYPNEVRKDTDVREWLADYAKDHPEIAAKSGTEEKPAAKEEKKPKPPLDNAGGRTRPATKANLETSGEKTARPGQANSMTKQEIAAQGYRW